MMLPVRTLNTLDPHYLKSPHLRTCLLTKIHLYPQNQYLQSFPGHLTTEDKWEKKALPEVRISSQGQRRSGSAFLVQLLHCIQVSFSQYVWCHVFHIFVLSLGDFNVLDASTYRAEVLPSVPMCKKGCDVPYGENTCVRSSSFKHALQCCQPWVRC